MLFRSVSNENVFVPNKDNDGLNQGGEYTAVFKEKDDITINYVTNDPTMGSVSKGQENLAPATGVATGSTVQPKPGYVFVGWYNEAGQLVSENLTFVPMKVEGLNVAATYTATFQEDTDVTITYESENETEGTVTNKTESIAPATGQPTGSTAQPKPGYAFDGWYDKD